MSDRTKSISDAPSHISINSPKNNRKSYVNYGNARVKKEPRPLIEFDYDLWFSSEQACNYLDIDCNALEYLLTQKKIKYELIYTNYDGKNAVRRVMLKSDVEQYKQSKRSLNEV